MRKGTSKELMDGAKERGQGGSERREEGATERGRRGREIGRQGNFKGGTLRRTLASSRERTKQHTTRPLPLRLWYCGYCDAS